MEEQNQVTNTDNQNLDQTPDWNKPKPVEDELNKYSGNKGLKAFVIVAVLVIIAALGYFLYQTTMKGREIKEAVTQKVEDQTTDTEKGAASGTQQNGAEEANSTDSLLKEMEDINDTDIDSTGNLLNEDEMKDLSE